MLDDVQFFGIVRLLAVLAMGWGATHLLYAGVYVVRAVVRDLRGRRRR